jgi:predicted metalloprotease with PDZ domain
LNYQVYALDASVRGAFLDTQRGFFNNTSLCVRVHGREHHPHRLTLVRSAAIAALQPVWQVASALPAHKVDALGFGSYQAQNYDELVDAPFELGAFWSGEFQAGGLAHRLVVTGAFTGWDSLRLLRDVQHLCSTTLTFWLADEPGKVGRQAPFERYLFILHVAHSGYGGLEHRNSTAMMCTRKDLPRLHAKPTEAYSTLLGLFSHEYFHAWNVKSMRPADLASLDYTRENHTELLWFFEGFTSYYDDLLLRRAQLLDDASYLKLLNKSINQVLQTPGRKVQSVAQASWDAWTKYYRQDENTANATVSYYTKGALVALCLDLKLRTEAASSLDAVMRQLWQLGRPITEADILQTLRACSGQDLEATLREWVHGRAELPLQQLLERQGVAVHEDPAQMAQRLGLRVEEGQELLIKAVLRGGSAHAAGLCAGDEWLGVEVPDTPHAHWRVRRLEDVAFYAAPYSQVWAWISRDERLLRLKLQLPHTSTWRLALQDREKISPWLGSP